MNDTILAFAGGISSGKSTLCSEVALALGWPIASFGRYVRGIAEQRQLQPSRGTLQAIGESLVRDQLKEFCSGVLAQAGWRPGQSLVLDGLRHVEVATALRAIIAPAELWIVYIAADSTTRESREQRRNRVSTPLVELEKHSTESQVATALPQIADLTVDGTKPVAELGEMVARWVRSRIR